MDLTLLPPFFFIYRNLSHTHPQTYLHTQLLQTHPSASCSSPRPAVSSPPFTPLPTTSDEVPPARPLLPLAHSASWCNLSSRPVQWGRILPKPDEEIPHSWSVHHLFCLYPKASVLTAFSWVSVQRSSLCSGKITLKPDMRHWNAETSSISRWLTQDFIFMSHYPFIVFGCLLGKSNFCSLRLQFSFNHSNIHTQASPHLLVAFSRASFEDVSNPQLLKHWGKSLWVLTENNQSKD